jgi:nicotine blue oxidoreductase
MMMTLLGKNALLSSARPSYGPVSTPVNEPRDPWFNWRVRIVAVVLAAGEGRRIGGPKGLLRIGGTTFLAHASALLARPAVASVVAVLGAEADRVRAEGRLAEGVTVVVNERWREGMLSSVLAGLDAAEALGAEAVLIHPVDHPGVDPATIERVAEALLRGAAIAVPSWEGRRGHPGGFARPTWEALRAAPAARGARAVLEDHPDWIVHVPGDPGCTAGIDTPDDLERWIRLRR